VVKLVTLLFSAVSPVKRAATPVERRATLRKNAPAKPPHNQCPLLPLRFFQIDGWLYYFL